MHDVCEKATSHRIYICLSAFFPGTLLVSSQMPPEYLLALSDKDVEVCTPRHTGAVFQIQL